MQFGNSTLSNDSISGTKEAYWTKQFTGSLPILICLPIFQDLGSAVSGDLYTFQLAKNLLIVVNSLLTNQVTLYTLYLAVYNVLLMKYTNQKISLLVCQQLDGPCGFGEIVGLFVNTLRFGISNG